jgi:uncharacterized repeat protein (TIGR03843 family)
MSEASPELQDGELVLQGRITTASNATFVGEIDGVTVVYKPVAGEQPLWDFPGCVLADREVAAYVVSEALGWGVVPRTWLRGGPHGPGMVQEWQDVDPDQEAVTLFPEGQVPGGWKRVFDGTDGRNRSVTLVHEDTPALRRMAVFDVLVNNADRKGGHVLEMVGGHRYGVDHGLTFHVENKLRTVLWGWLGDELTPEEREGVGAVRSQLAGRLGADLAPLLTDLEIDVLARRCDRLLAKGRFPGPRGEMPAVPWPPF